MDNFNIHNWKANFAAKGEKQILKEEKKSLNESPMYFDAPTNWNEDFYLLEPEQLEGYISSIVYGLMEEGIINPNAPKRKEKMVKARKVIEDTMVYVFEKIKKNMYASDFVKSCSAPKK